MAGGRKVELPLTKTKEALEGLARGGESEA